MKKKDFIKKLSDMTGIKAKDLVEHINSEEEEIEGLELPDLQFFTEEELESRLKNHGSKSGNTAIEMAVKDARNKHEFEFEGKTIDNLVEAAMNKGRAESAEEIEQLKGEPNTQLEEKDGIIETLKKNLKQAEEDKQVEVEKLNNKLGSIESNNMIASLIPDKLDTELSSNDILVLFKNDRSTKKEDDVIVFTDAQGNVLRDDKSQDPLPGKQVMSDWLTEKNIKVQNDDGRGGDDEHGNKTLSTKGIKTTEDFYNYCKDNNVPNRERAELLTEIQKENPEFALDG